MQARQRVLCNNSSLAMFLALPIGIGNNRELASRCHAEFSIVPVSSSTYHTWNRALSGTLNITNTLSPPRPPPIQRTTSAINQPFLPQICHFASTASCHNLCLCYATHHSTTRPLGSPEDAQHPHSLHVRAGLRSVRHA
ncbi:hypothetical protein BDU57DRAFT_523830 [Ampelomyces quisqualis]|uniref:Uncharacterized protein n=1 Tax=Ampelomyces quisqualis TaxID=50730 RepID=A0A6A5Q8Z0_AMPQU|nr:hypothetical protein BDU57DRAFT_523830 [Ampelomyces quisqualis]